MYKVVVTPKVDGDFGYFKGMKSVGQNDTDSHKIEILSQNKNLIDIPCKGLNCPISSCQYLFLKFKYSFLWFL